MAEKQTPEQILQGIYDRASKAQRTVVTDAQIRQRMVPLNLRISGIRARSYAPRTNSFGTCISWLRAGRRLCEEDVEALRCFEAKFDQVLDRIISHVADQG